MSIYDKGQCCNGWLLLVRAHDKLWRDKHFSFSERRSGCGLLHRLSLSVLEDHDTGTHNKPRPPSCGHIDCIQFWEEEQAIRKAEEGQ